MKTFKISLKWLTGLSVVILLVTLYFGLRPKDFDFSNNVKWTKNPAGIRFNRYGIAYTDPIEELREDNGFGENGFTIEIALRLWNNEEDFNFIFVLNAGNDRKQLLLGQWRSWIIAMNGDAYDHKRRTKRISVNSASGSSAVKFITLTTGKDGTRIYIDGQAIRTEKDLTLRVPHGGSTRLILGNSAYDRNSWKGDIYGLAIYRQILTAREAAHNFNRWSQTRNFSFAKNGKPVILYKFDGKEGTRVLDHAGGGHDLKIPSRMPILKKKILLAPWKGFIFVNGSVEDILWNIVGFIPLGFIAAATCDKAGSKHSIVIAVTFCFTVSLLIEIIQAWLPSRSSDLLDLILNTLGALLGARTYRRISGTHLVFTD